MEPRTYEGLFLLDPTQSSQDWEGIKKQILGMLERRSGNILSCKKWGERKLAYEIKGHKRGTYMLVYFQMPAENIATVKSDIRLSELVLRNLILAHKKPLSKESLETSPSLDGQEKVEAENTYSQEKNS